MELNDRELRLGSGELVIIRPKAEVKPGYVDVSDELLVQALAWVSSQDRQFLKVQVNFPQAIGYTTCVETDTNDENIFYAKRPGRAGYSRLIVGRDPEPCSSVVVILKMADTAGIYVLITAYIGLDAPHEPWDPHIQGDFRQRQRSLAFWRRHAFVADETAYIGPSAIGACPWR